MINPYKIFIQARMSSSRFPGKILAPFNNAPMIKSTIDRCKNVTSIKKNDVIVVTSDQPSDDILCLFCKSIRCNYFRGNLNNVVERFIQAASFYNAKFIIRINADSPLIDPKIISNIIDNHDKNFDITSNVFPRTYPKGQSVEIIKLSSLKKIVNNFNFNNDHAEHVTQYFYENSSKYKIKNVFNTNRKLSHLNLSIDTIEDYNRLTIK